MWPSADFAARIFAGRKLRRAALLDFHGCFSQNTSPLLGKRSAHEREQLAGLLVGFRGGDKADVHAPDLVDLVVIDLREDERGRRSRSG